MNVSDKEILSRPVVITQAQLEQSLDELDKGFAFHRNLKIWFVGSGSAHHQLYDIHQSK